MRVRYIMAACGVVLMTSLAAFSAASSPVADAAEKGDKAAVKALIQQKADVNMTQADGATAIQWAAYRNDLDIADLLIAAGANVKTPNRDGFTPLVLASINGSGPMIGKLLAAGADVNERDPNQETPIMFASRNGNVEAIKVLIDHKADVNAKEKLRGTTALMWASEQGHPEAVKALVAAGADVAAVTNNDTKGARAYLAPSVAARRNSAQGAGGLGAAGGGGGGGRGRGGANAAATGGAPAAAGQVASVGAPAAGGAPAGGGRGGRGRGRGAAAAPAAGAAGADAEVDVQAADEAAAAASFGRQSDSDGGGLTPLVFAARQNCLECAKELIEAGANVNQTTHYGWTALLTATQNRHYILATYLLEKGADPNIANHGGWSPLYIATDNRNIEGGDYPARKPDMDHLAYIKTLIDKGANVNVRVCGIRSTPTSCTGDSTETRTNFTMQWLQEDGATPFLRASQSGDVELMKLLLAHGADPKIKTAHNVSALEVASGIAWVEGVTYEWSPEQNLEAVKMILDLGVDPNSQDDDGRAALHGAAHKGRNDVIQVLVDHGAKLDLHDFGSRDTVNGDMKGWTWIPLHYAEGLVRVGVQSAIAHPDTAVFIKKLMAAQGLEIPKDITSSICLTKGLKGCQ
ncbi:MAG TPA: ankyrin repeat domain-containing protein [Bryobacteraceae bacterium]